MWKLGVHLNSENHNSGKLMIVRSFNQTQSFSVFIEVGLLERENKLMFCALDSATLIKEAKRLQNICVRVKARGRVVLERKVGTDISVLDFVAVTKMLSV